MEMSATVLTPLTRVAEILRSGGWAVDSAVDSVSLTYDERHRRRLRYIATHGTTFLLDLPRATVLHAGDGLRLDDGRVVRVDAAPESLVEITASNVHTLVRLAWHVGNRHIPAQLEPHRLVIRYDSVIVSMVIGLGAAVRPFEGAFTPESGAYDEASTANGHHGHGTQSILTGHRHDD